LIFSFAGRSVILGAVMLRRMRLVAAVAASMLVAGAAEAQSGCNQSPTQLEVNEARSLFIDGSGDVEGFRWADAIPKFERSYALSCAPSALYNLAMALRALGRHREARDAFDRLLGEHPDFGGEPRELAARYRREEAARVAVLLLAGIDPDTRPEIHFDGRDVLDDGTRPVRIETDAGAHSLVATIPSHQPFLWEGRLGDGQTETVEVRFTPISQGGGVDLLPILLGVGAAVLAAAGIAIGVVLWQDAQVQPLSPGRLVSVDG
jgi:hypothetical protein